MKFGKDSWKALILAGFVASDVDGVAGSICCVVAVEAEADGLM